MKMIVGCTHEMFQFTVKLGLRFMRPSQEAVDQYIFKYYVRGKKWGY